MTCLEGDCNLCVKGSRKGRSGDPVHFLKRDHASVLQLSVNAVGYIHYIVADIFSNYKPGTPAHAETLALPDRVEPVTLVDTDLLPCGNIDYRALFLAQMTGQKIRIVDFPKETYSLGIFTCGVGETCFPRDFPYF